MLHSSYALLCKIMYCTVQYSIKRLIATLRSPAIQGGTEKRIKCTDTGIQTADFISIFLCIQDAEMER